MTNILVTGIEGFVGSHLAEILLTKADIRLFGLVIKRPVSSRLEAFKGRIEIVEADVVDPERIRRVVGEIKPHKIFHLAGQAFVPTALKDPESTFRTNIQGGVHLLESVRKVCPDCSILIVSSGEVYGAVDQAQLPITEKCAINPNNLYAASKACIDLIAQQYRNSFNLNVVVARPFNHIGPGQSDLFVSSAFAKQIVEVKAGLREPKLQVGNLTPKRDFTDVRDVVRAYDLMLERPLASGVFNVCSGKAVSISRILEMLLEISDINVEIVLDPQRQRAAEVMEVVGSAYLLESATGWRPKIPPRDTLRDLLAYWERRVSPALL